MEANITRKIFKPEFPLITHHKKILRFTLRANINDFARTKGHRMKFSTFQWRWCELRQYKIKVWSSQFRWNLGKRKTKPENKKPSITVTPRFTDIHVIRTLHYYRQFALSLGKESSQLIRTLSMAPQCPYKLGFTFDFIIIWFSLKPCNISFKHT